MKTPLTYGLGIAIATGVFLLIQYLAGLHSDPTHIVWAQRLQTVGTLIGVLGIWAGLRQVRATNPNGRISYGQCVGIGVLIALVWGLASALINYVYFAYLNPDYPEIMRQFQLQGMRSMGAPEAVIEQQEKRLQTWMSPMMMAMMTPISIVFMGLIISLLLGATMIQRLKIMTLVLIYGFVGGLFGMVQGLGTGLMKHAVLATMSTHAVIGGLIGALVTLALLLATKYQPRKEAEDIATPEPPPVA